MLKTLPYKTKTTTSKTIWANAGITRRETPERKDTLVEIPKIFMNSETRSIIEECLLNGKIQVGSNISFPLGLNQQTRLLSRIDKNIILADTSSGENFEVKLLRLYTKDEWSSLMALGNMAPVSIPGRAIPMDYGCQISIISKTH